MCCRRRIRGFFLTPSARIASVGLACSTRIMGRECFCIGSGRQFGYHQFGHHQMINAFPSGQGGARRDWALRVVAALGRAGHGAVRRGKARQGFMVINSFWQGRARCDRARSGPAGLCRARRGSARPGMVWRVLSRQGAARQGKVRRCVARLGSDRPGRAGLG
jgi:hypothetical protein